MDHLILSEEFYMQAYRIETKLEQDKKLVLENLPFHAGESIEIIILSQSPSPVSKNYQMRCDYPTVQN